MRYWLRLGVAVVAITEAPSSTPVAAAAGERARKRARVGRLGASGVGGDARRVEMTRELRGCGAGPIRLAPVVCDNCRSLLAVSDPNKGAVVTGDSVVVLCDASAAKTLGATIDTQTVKIEAFDAKGVAIGTPATASTQNAIDPDEYGATFSLVKQPNGPISFKCSVCRDKSTSPTISASDDLSTFLDEGPTITPASPLPLSSFSLKSKVLFKFTVTPAPLSDADKSAAVDMTAGSERCHPDCRRVESGHRHKGGAERRRPDHLLGER